MPIAAVPVSRRPAPAATPSDVAEGRQAEGGEAMPPIKGGNDRRGSVMTVNNFPRGSVVSLEPGGGLGGDGPAASVPDAADTIAEEMGGKGEKADESSPSGGEDIVGPAKKRSVEKAIAMSRLSATFSRDIINSISTSRPIPEDKSRMYYLSVIESEDARSLLNEVAMGVSEGLCPTAAGADLPPCALSMVAEGVPDGPQVYIEKHATMHANTVVACGRKRFCELTFPNNPELCSRLHFFIIRLANGNFVLIDVGSLAGIIQAKSTKDAEKMKVPSRPKRMPIEFKLGKALILRAGGLVIQINTGNMQMFDTLQAKKQQEKGRKKSDATHLPPA